MTARSHAIIVVALAVSAVACSKADVATPSGTGASTTVLQSGAVATTDATFSSAKTATPSSVVPAAVSPTTTGGPNAASPSTAASIQPSPPATEDPAVVQSAYQKAFEDECRAIWSIASNGALADPDDPDTEFSVSECLADLSPDNADAYGSIAEATEQGKYDADDAANALASTLCDAATGKCWNY